MAYQMAKDTSDLPRPRGGGGGRADRTVVKMRRRSRSVDVGVLSDMSTPNGPPPQPPSHSSPSFPFRGGGYPALVKRGGGGGERGHGPPPPHPPSSSLGGQTPPPPTPLPRADHHLGGGATPTPAPRKAPPGGGAGTSDTLRRLHTQTSSPPLEDSALNNGSLSPKAMSSSDKKGLIINEIVTTERDYVRDMEMVITVFYQPLKNENILDEQTIKTLFSNLETIANVNKQLLSELERMDQNKKSVGDVFTGMAAYLKMYIPYCADQPRVLGLLEQLKSSNEKFSSFLITVEQNPQCRGLNFGSFIIKPIQRICKYPLFLKELHRVTLETDPEYASLVTATEKIESVTSYINEGKRTAENQQKMVDLQHCIEGVGNLAGPSRKFVRDGAAREVQKDKQRDRHLFLFTDLLVIAKPKRSDQYELVVKCPLDETRIIVLADTPEMKFAFEIGTADNKIYKLGSNTDEERNEWVKDIKGFIKEFQKRKAKEKADAMILQQQSASAVFTTTAGGGGSRVDGGNSMSFSSAAKTMSAMDRVKNTFRKTKNKPEGGSNSSYIPSSNTTSNTVNSLTLSAPTQSTISSSVDSPKISRPPPLSHSSSLTSIPSLPSSTPPSSPNSLSTSPPSAPSPTPVLRKGPSPTTPSPASSPRPPLPSLPTTTTTTPTPAPRLPPTSNGPLSSSQGSGSGSPRSPSPGAPRPAPAPKGPPPSRTAPVPGGGGGGPMNKGPPPTGRPLPGPGAAPGRGTLTPLRPTPASAPGTPPPGPRPMPKRPS